MLLQLMMRPLHVLFKDEKIFVVADDFLASSFESIYTKMTHDINSCFIFFSVWILFEIRVAISTVAFWVFVKKQKKVASKVDREKHLNKIHTFLNLLFSVSDLYFCFSYNVRFFRTRSFSVSFPHCWNKDKVSQTVQNSYRKPLSQGYFSAFF